MITILFICAILSAGAYLLIRFAPAKFEVLLQIIICLWHKLQFVLNIRTTGKDKDTSIASAQNRINNLEEYIKQIEEQKKTLDNEYSELKKRYLTMSSKLNDANKKKAALQQQIDDLLDNSILLSQSVSCSFCEEYKQIARIIDAGTDSILGILETITESKEEKASELNEEVVEFLRDSLFLESAQQIKRWFYSLDSVKVIKGPAVIDLKSKLSEETQLAYLRQNAFQDYYRPVLSSMLLVFEHVRYSSPEVYSNSTKYINYIIETIKEFGLDVLYIPTGTVYEGDDFASLNIIAVNNVSIPSNYVSRVIKIGINSREFITPFEKTIIEMNI